MVVKDGKYTNKIKHTKKIAKQGSKRRSLKPKKKWVPKYFACPARASTESDMCSKPVMDVGNNIHAV